MNKLLVVSGPTAIGKTDLAVNLAKKFDGELVSADSRQVYKQLDIGTGKDLPPDTKFTFRNNKLGGYYFMNEVPVWGYDLVDPYQDFSVAQYVKSARAIFNDIWTRNKLPILVGGTGFYVQALLDGVETLDIPQNKPLRKMLETMNVDEVFEILAQLDAAKAASLNSSDRKNKVRLVRAIEIADARIRGQKSSGIKKVNADILAVGLTADKNIIKNRVEKRVSQRINDGLIDEIKRLLDQGVTWDNQSMTSMGYSQWKEYFEGTKTKNEVVEIWIHDEQKYVKRQMTWFKKDKRINWFDTQNKGWQKKVEDMVQKWYSTTNEAR